MTEGDLIYRDDLTTAYDAAHKGPPGGARKLIEEAPAIDAAPVVHGRWETFKDVLGFSHYQCSECGDEWRRDDKNRQGAFTMRYCPKCGAKMDGGEGNATD